MSPFQASPQSIVNSARDLFVSERFADAFSLMNESMPDAEQALKLAILRGQKTIVASDTDADSVDIVDDYDEDYQQLCKEVLENYDFLVRIDDTLYQVTRSQSFDLSLIVSDNPLFNAFKASEGEPVDMSKYQFSDALQSIESHMAHLMSAPFVVYTQGEFYALECFDRPNYFELCTVYDKAIDAAAAYTKAWS